MPHAASHSPEPKHTRFVRLLKQHERRLNGYVLGLVPNWNDADDILQEVAVRLWDQFDDYRPEADFGGWACTIAHYEVLSYRKRAGRNALQAGPAFDQAVLEEMAAAERAAGPRLNALRECLEKLSEAQRAFLHAYYSGAATIPQLAARFDRSVASAYKDLAGLRQSLRLCIDRTLREEHVQ